MSRAKELTEKLKTALHEASFSRLISHIERGDCLGFISADRSDAMPSNVLEKLLIKYGYKLTQLEDAKLSDSKFRREYDEVLRAYNNKRYVDLKNNLSYLNKVMKLGYYRVVGGYIETLKDGSKVKVEEKSVVIFAPADKSSELLNALKGLGARYEQDSIMFVENGKATWHYTTGKNKGKTEYVGTFQPKQIGDYYSKLLGKTISFVDMNESYLDPMTKPSQIRAVEKFVEQYNALQGSSYDYFEQFLSIYETEEILSSEEIVKKAFNVKDLTENLKNPFYESSLARIWAKSQDFDCVTISAFRGSNTKELNKLQTERMLRMLKSLDYSVTTITGQYLETQKDGTDKLVKEISFFVANHKNDPNFLDQMKKLGELFDQDSICVIEKGFKTAYLFGTNKTGWLGYHRVDKFSGVSIDTIEKKYFSAIGGKSFQFKSIVEALTESYPYYSNWLGKMGLESGRKKTIKSLSEMKIHEDLL